MYQLMIGVPKDTESTLQRTVFRELPWLNSIDRTAVVAVYASNDSIEKCFAQLASAMDMIKLVPNNAGALGLIHDLETEEMVAFAGLIPAP